MGGIRKAAIMSDIKLILENFRNKMAESEEDIGLGGSYPGDGIEPLFRDDELNELVDLDFSLNEEENNDEAGSLEDSEEFKALQTELRVGQLVAAAGFATSFIDMVLVMLGDRFPEFRKKMNDFVLGMAATSMAKMHGAASDLKDKVGKQISAEREKERQAKRELANAIRTKIKEYVEADTELNELREEAEHLTDLVKTSHRKRKNPGIKGLRTPEATEIRKKQKEVFAQFKDRIEIVVVGALKEANVKDLRYKSRTNYPTDAGGFGDYATNLARRGK